MDANLELENLWTPVLGARYRPERVLARGGFGLVVQASDRRTRRRVAIKLLRQEHGADPRMALRFLQQGKIVTKVSHPHVLPPREFGIDRGQPFVVLPFVAGTSLRDRLAAGPMEGRTVARLARDLAQGLAAIHAAGVAHGDLRPDNIMFDEGDELLITDFGVSLPGATRLDAWSWDIYALGATLYELLAGHPPLAAAPVAGLVPGCPRWLDALIRDLLARDPDARPPAHRVARDLTVRVRVEEALPRTPMPA